MAFVSSEPVTSPGEDDLVITETGNDVLTASCPKEIADVERACAR